MERRKLRVLTQLGELCIHGTFLSSTPPPPEGLGSGIQDGVAESSWARDEPSGPEATRPLHHQHRRPHGPGRTIHLLPQGQPVGECLARPLKSLSRPPPLKGAAPTDLGRGRSGRPRVAEARPATGGEPARRLRSVGAAGDWVRGEREVGPDSRGES